MSRNNYKKSRLKYVFLAFACATTFAFSGIASACGKSPNDEESEKTTSKEDTQLLKNGNFEFFNIPDKKEGGNDPEYLIKAPTNWSHGGTTSYTMSGIISTSDTAWTKMTADDLAGILDYNNALDSSASNYLSEYVDYNGMKSSDILYKDQYEALRTDDDYKEGEEIPEDRKDTIENPSTHYNVISKGGKLYADVDGVEKEVFVDEDGEYFLEYDAEKDEYSNGISNILMLHNYATTHNGIAQTYSSVEIELPANTSAEVSVWVKTAHLKFSQGKDVSQDRGASISVTQSVGNSSLDKFTISCINTEKLLSEGKIDSSHNGWVQYTVYINACDFASTSIKVELGLGETGYTTEGYAFFDDVTVTKYVSLDQSESYKANKDKLADTTCILSTDASEKIYKADSHIRNGGAVNEPRYSRNFHYLIDLASEQSEGSDDTYTPVNFENVTNLKAGLTIDSDNYVSSKQLNYKTNIPSFDYSNVRLPFTSDLKNNGLKTDGDYLAYVTAGHDFKNDTTYSDKLNSALKSAENLPKNSVTNLNNMLVMLSAYGAAYTTSFDLSIPAEGYQIISFWVKTSDMNGSTAATLKITQKDNDDNSSSFTLDTTNIVTDIGDSDDEKDIYNGWVQCFFFVKNELEEDKSFTVDFSFGNTAIKGTDVNSYKNGWVALANMQYLNVNEDIFSYTGSGNHTASLTISEEEEKNAQVFDSAYANQSHEIKDGMVIASSYKGVNGKSSAVYNNGHVSIPFDEFNNNVDDNGNKFTGLINKKYFVDGSYGTYNDVNSLFRKLLDSFNVSNIDATKAWNDVIFDTKSVQPLVITNVTRTSYVEMKGATEETYKNYLVKDEDGNFVPVKDDAEFDAGETYYSLKKVRNYGYIGDKKDVSSNSYSTISVKVKASKNAVAYVYLVDTSAGKNLLSFGAPTYSFYYDVDGNVLKAEPKDNATITEQRANIAYTLRDDGLYEDESGKLYANLYNYSKLYYENIEYFDKDGNSYNIDNLSDSVTYYDENGKIANHYLVTGSGIKVYQYLDGNYHYIVEGKTQKEVVLPFDTEVAQPRYDFSGVSEDYVVKVEGPSDWVTVTFVIHAGSEAKSYRLELWSGKRDETGLENGDENANAPDGGVVLFDYSYTSISDDSMKGEYEKEIIKAYLKAFADAGKSNLLSADTTGKNIAYYEKLAKENGISIDTVYKAHYYTYSLYDSANFQPFNKEVASDNATGYDYSVSAQKESLAYLQVKDGNEYTVFADYSAIDQNVTLNNPSNDDKNDHDDDDKNGSDGSIWLLASSIILVIALVFAIIAIFLKDAIKKARRNRVTSKNVYDQRKANRYKRKLRLQPEATVEVENNGEDEVIPEEPVDAEDEVIPEEPADEAPEATEEVTDSPVEPETPEDVSDGEEKPE